MHVKNASQIVTKFLRCVLAGCGPECSPPWRAQCRRRGPALRLASTLRRGYGSLALRPALCLPPGAAEGPRRRGPRRATRSQASRDFALLMAPLQACRTNGCGARGSPHKGLRARGGTCRRVLAPLGAAARVVTCVRAGQVVPLALIVEATRIDRRSTRCGMRDASGARANDYP